MDSSKFIDDDKQKYQFLDLSKYQGIDENRIKRMLFDATYVIKSILMHLLVLLKRNMWMKFI